MHNVNEKKDNTVRNVLVGAAVVGAGVAAAAILSKEENRKKIGKVISDIGDKKDEIVKNIEREFNYVKSNIEKSTEAGVKELKKEADSISLIVEEIKKSNKDNVGDLITQVKDSIRNLRRDFDRLSKK